MPLTIRNTKGPINDLFYAINLYISTGDYLGKGTAAEAEDRRLFVIVPLSKTNPDDQADAARLRQRVTEILQSGIVSATLERHPNAALFDYLVLTLVPDDAGLFACELVRQQGGDRQSDCQFPDTSAILVSAQLFS